MSQLVSIFSQFKTLTQIPIPDISRWLKLKDDANLQNFIGNRLLYPETISVSEDEIDIDFAILREVAFRQPTLFLNIPKKRIILLSDIISRFTPIKRLIDVLIGAIDLPEIVGVVSQVNGQEIFMGTIITPGNLMADMKILINDRLVRAPIGEITFLPYSDQTLSLRINGQPPVSIVGGGIGVVIDLKQQGPTKYD